MRGDAHYLAVLDALGEGVLVQDASGRIQSANQRTRELLGILDDESLAETRVELQVQLFDALGAPLAATDRPGYRAILSGQPVVDQLVRCARDGHEDVWLELSSYPLREPGAAEPYGVATSIRDVTARHGADSKVRHLSALVESSGDAIIGYDLEGIIVSWNGGAERLYGHTAAEAVGQPGQMLIPASREDDLPSILERVRIGREVERFESERVRRDGTIIEVAVSLSPLLDEAGRVIGVSSIGRDISDLRALERTLLADRRSLAEAQRIGQIGSFERDIATGALRWSDELYRLFGVTPGTTLDDDAYLSIVHPDDRAGVGAAARAAFERGQAGDLEHRIVASDGTLRWVHVRYLVSPDGLRMFGTVLDITDRKRAEEAERSQSRAEEATRLKTAFLSRMSHELRTPLNAILGFGQLLEMDDLSTNQRDSVGHILRAGKHLLELIGELLDISTIEHGAMRLSIEPVDAGQIVDEVVSMLGPVADERGVRLVVDRNSFESSRVLADRQRFKQVMMNLLSNAVKYNKDGGEVRLGGARRDAERYRVTVADTGVGVAEDEIERLFKPFERLWSGETFVEGVGLGLALSKELTNAMHGEIGVDSRLGHGSAFWVELPTAR